MARCQDCNKFVGLEPGDPELTGDIDVDDGKASFEIHLARNCSECGNELKYADFQFELENPVFSSKCEPEDDPDSDGEHDWELEAESESSERMEDKDRNGKQITKTRFMKKMIGVSGTLSGSCSKCGTTVEMPFSQELQASAFDDA